MQAADSVNVIFKPVDRDEQNQEPRVTGLSLECNDLDF